jgi:hypothetical protein
MRLFPPAILAALVLLIAGSATLASDTTAVGKPLTGDQIRSLLVGNTALGPLRAILYDFGYTADGVVYGTLDSGTWRITHDERYCHKFVMLFNATERCYRWYALGDGRYRMVNVDAYRTLNIDVWRIEPGLPR